MRLSLRAAWLFGLAAMLPAAAYANDVIIQPGQTYDLSTDLSLSGGDTLEARGTPDNPCVIVGHGHRILGRGLTGHVTIRGCVVRGAGGADEAAAALDVTAEGGGHVAIESTIFDASGSVRLHLHGQSTARVTGCVFRENGVASIQDELVGSRYVAAFHADGASTGEKVFQGNSVMRSGVTFEGVTGWLIGGWRDQDSNVLVGHRGALRVRGDHVKVVGNFINPQYPLRSPDVENLVVDGPEDAHDLVVEHNVLRGGEWVLRACRGEVRYNVIADMNGHAWIKGPTECAIHHNVFVNYDNPDHNAEGGIDVVYLAKHLAIFDNTFDGGGKIGRLDVPAVHVKQGRVVERLTGNAFTNMLTAEAYAIVGRLGPDKYEDNPPPGAARLLRADHNLFWNPDAPTKKDYDIAGGPGPHDVNADPAFAGPLPEAFPFASADVLARKVTISAMLARYRALYTPGPQSPLVGANEAGTNIGAIGQGLAKDPADRFGTLAPPPDNGARAKGAPASPAAAKTGGCGCGAQGAGGPLAALSLLALGAVVARRAPTPLRRASSARTTRGSARASWPRRRG